MTLFLFGVGIGLGLGAWGHFLANAVSRWRKRRSSSSKPNRPSSWDKFAKSHAELSGPGLSVVAFDASTMRQIDLNVIDLAELNQLFTKVWGSPKFGYGDVLEHSYAWVTARQAGELVGFANIAWDGRLHFFLLDISVHHPEEEDRIFSMIVESAVERCRIKGGWLRIDMPPEVIESFLAPLGFKPTSAGLIDLRTSSEEVFLS